jgi:hypothetical protein
MADTIKIPVFLPVSSGDDSIGEPATLGDVLSRRVKNALNAITLDESAIHNCAKSAFAIVKSFDGGLGKNSHVRVETLDFEMGVSTTGKVAFLGSGVDVELAAKFVVKLAVTRTETSK